MNAFLMVGQSNMSGRGGLKELPDISNPHVRVWRGEGWETAVEPVVRDKPAIAAAGMGPAFGTSVYMMTGEDVGLIPCSLGGGADSGEPRARDQRDFRPRGFVCGREPVGQRAVRGFRGCAAGHDRKRGQEGHAARHGQNVL